jgi:hypothetical protein
MNIKLFSVAMGIALTATAISANAQKTYTEGLVTYTMTTAAGSSDSKIFFRGDSSVTVNQYGPAKVSLITTSKHTYFAVTVEVPVASMKKAAVLTPDELDQAIEDVPKYTFAPGTETKQISGFNCKKVIATDPKTKSTVELWVTADIVVPPTSITSSFAGAGGFPVQFTATQQGQSATFTLASVTEQKVPKGTFGIPKDFDRISYDEMKAMGKR